MQPPKPVDNCIKYIERRIKELKCESYQNSDPFIEGLLLGIEVGIKQEKGEFDINKIEFKKQQSND